MREIIFIHSFSTRPLLINCYEIGELERLLTHVRYFTLSVAYLRRLRAKIILHTDTLGARMLGHLPYADVKLTLDGAMDDIHPRFWAAGKFLALQAEEAPCVHIDGDVFIKSEQALNAIKEKLSANDILCQGMDAACMYSLEIPLFSRETEFCESHHCVPDGRDAFNTGTLGFSNDKAKNVVVDNYLSIARYFSRKYGDVLDEFKNLTPDLIAEQKMMEGISRECGFKADILLHDLNEASKIGYQHVYTVDKHNDVDMCMETLKKVDSELYVVTEKLCGSLNRKNNN